MARPLSSTLTEGEQDIMEILWKCGDCTVRQVVDVLQAHRPVAYTSVATMLGVLERKGHLQRVPGQKPIVFQARLSRTAARALALKNLVERYFGQSPQAFAQFLVADETLDEIQVEDLERLIHERTDQNSGEEQG